MTTLTFVPIADVEIVEGLDGLRQRLRSSWSLTAEAVLVALDGDVGEPGTSYLVFSGEESRRLGRGFTESVAGFEPFGRGLLLLSHCQASSVREWPRTDAIDNALRSMLATRRVRAWFRGHERRRVVFASHCVVAHRRCVAHRGCRWAYGGGPKPVRPSRARECRDSPHQGAARWAHIGSAVPNAGGPTVTVRYIDRNSVEHKREALG